MGARNTDVVWSILGYALFAFMRRREHQAGGTLVQRSVLHQHISTQHLTAGPRQFAIYAVVSGVTDA